MTKAKPYGKYGRTCIVCGKPKPQAHWSSVATCGRKCGTVVWMRRFQTRRADGLRAQLKIFSKRERLIYMRAYQAGYQRARYRYGMRKVA